MGTIRTRFVLKHVALYLAFTTFLVAIIPQNSWAYLIESQNLSHSREADMNTIQRVLESKVVSQRLSELGLSMDEINSRMGQLSDADIHQFASQMDSLMPGGDTKTVLWIVIIAILVLIGTYLALVHGVQSSMEDWNWGQGNPQLSLPQVRLF